MKRIFLLLFFLPILLQASDWTVEGRVAYFYPTSRLIREIYPRGGADYQLEASRRVFCNWHLWGSFNYFTKKGHSLGLHDDTRINIYPFSLGVKYNFCFFKHFRPYVGAGATYTLLRIRDHSEHVKEHVHKNGFGLVIKSGINFPIINCIFLDIFADYYYQQMHFRSQPGLYRHEVNLSGFKFGAGIGVAF